MKWNFSVKDVVYLVLIGVLCFFGWRAYKSLKAEVQQTSIAYKQMSETLARAANNMVTKTELYEYAKSTELDFAAIKSDLKKMGADLVAVGTTVATIDKKIEANQDSTGSEPHDPPEQPDTCDLCDIHKYTAAIQLKEIKIGDMPYGTVRFDASNSKPWTVETDEIDIEVSTALGESGEKDVKLFYHTISMVNKSNPAVAGKKYKLKITSSEFKQTTKNNKEFYWWAPHLDLTLNSLFALDSDDVYRFGGALGLSIMGYGLTKDDNEWRFVRLGLGIDSKEKPYVTLEPVLYNLGKYLPLVSDLWLGIGGFYDEHWGISISLGTTL